MKLVISLEASRDFEDIGDAVARHSPRAAARLVEDLRKKSREIARFPFAFQRLENYDADWLRRRVVGSYLVLYRVEDEKVIILRVLHSARDISSALTRRS